MPHRRTNTLARGMTEREDFDRSYLEESASEMSREEEISGRYGAGRPRSYDVDGFGDSDRGQSRIAGSRDYSRHAGGASRGHGAHRATRGEDSSDDDSLAGESVGPRSRGIRDHRGMIRADDDSFDDDSLAGESAGRRFGGTRGQRGMRGENYEESSDDDSLAGESAGPRYVGARGQRVQRPSYSRGTGSRYTDDSTEEFTDDESAYRARGARGGVAASARRQQLSLPRRRGEMYPGGRAGSVDSLDSEAELGVRNPGLHPYGGERAPGSYGRYDSGRDSDRRRY